MSKSMNSIQEYSKNEFIFIFFTVLFILIIYSNTFHVPFLFDDSHNIVEREVIRLSTITPDKVIDTFFHKTETSKTLYRPISNLSFALNYYFGEYNPTGYHLVNISIHAATAIFLYFTLLTLLEIASVNTTILSDKKNIAGLAALLWAVHPINTQAVTYIVQRMASLTTMFYIIGIWAYLKFRQNKNTQNNERFINVYNLKFIFLSTSAFLCACLSKENAAIFPFCILLIEFFIFNSYEKIKTHPKTSLFIIILFVLIPLIVAVIFYDMNDIESIFSGYYRRPFNLKQRLLTEFRIVVFYISQLLYPTPDRFSIEHYFALSETLFNPISTLFSILLIISLAVSSLFMNKKYALVGFSILFYFIHHIIESTIYPLELVFEHRNYMPALFFFLPISIGIFKAIDFYNNKGKKALQNLIVIFSIMLIFLLGMSSYIRNNDWLSSKSLWESALRVAPFSTRPYNNIGYLYTDRNKINAALALYYFEQGLKKELTYNIFEKTMLWINIARTYIEIKDLKKAEEAALNALNTVLAAIDKNADILNKESTNTFLSECYSMLSYIYSNSNIDKALFNIDKALSFDNQPTFYTTKAAILTHKHEYKNSLDTLFDALKESQNLTLSNKDDFLFEIYFLIGKNLTFLEHYERGFWFYKLALSKLSDKELNQAHAKIYFHIADNRYMAGETDAGNSYIKMATRIMPVYILLSYLNSRVFGDIPFINKTILIKNSKKFFESAFENN